MKKIFLLLINSFVLISFSLAQNVGIGVPNPVAKLDIAGNIKIADGNESNGRLLTSDGTGLATWKQRKKPRVIRVTDPNTSCGVYHTPLYNYAFTITDTTDYTVTGKSIRLASGRQDLSLLVDGIVVQVVISYTSAADGAQWGEASFSYGGTLLPGNHTFQVVPATAGVAWGCGNLYGNMIISLFD